MPTTRLLLAAVPPLLSDLIRDALAGEPGVDVVGTSSEADLPGRVRSDAADVVLAENDGPVLSEPHLRLMYQFPRLRLLTVSPDGRRAALWRMAPERRVLDDVSPGGLAEALRTPGRG